MQSLQVTVMLVPHSTGSSIFWLFKVVSLSPGLRSTSILDLKTVCGDPLSLMHVSLLHHI